MIPTRIPHPLWLTMTLSLLLGCSRSDERLVELSKQSLAQQAAQNEQLARQGQTLAEASRALVEADAQARAELLSAQRAANEQLHAERSSLDRQHEALEDERRQLAVARQREPVIAAAIQWSALLLASVLPLVVLIYLLRAGRSDLPDAGLCELLVYELTSLAERPAVTGDEPRAIASDPAPALLPDGAP